MAENPEEIKRSWALQTQWMTGPVAVNKLVPPPYAKIRTNFVQVWREEAQPNLDWAAVNYSTYIPETVRCISACYLRINLGTAKFKAYPGLYVIKTFRLRSGGQIVYECDYSQFLVDYCESISDQKLRQFGDIYLGGSVADSSSTSTREVKLPLLIPNSTYMRRSNSSTAGHGVFGTNTGNQKVEFELTLNSNLHVSSAQDNQAGAIAGQCHLMFHTVDVPNALRKKYEDLRGGFNVVIRRFTQLSPQWTHYANANTMVVDSLSQPSGTCTEVMLLAVPHAGADDARIVHDYIKPTHFEIIADSITQKLLDSATKVKTELFTNGFSPPVGFASPGRLCFASHASTDSTVLYSGGYNMTSASTIQFKFSFDQAVDYRLVAVQLAKCNIDERGILTSTLEF